MPTPKQMDKLAAEAARRAATPPEPHPGPADPLPEAYWASVLAEPQHRRRQQTGLDSSFPIRSNHRHE